MLFFDTTVFLTHMSKLGSASCFGYSPEIVVDLGKKQTNTENNKNIPPKYLDAKDNFRLDIFEFIDIKYVLMHFIKHLLKSFHN